MADLQSKFFLQFQCAYFPLIVLLCTYYSLLDGLADLAGSTGYKFLLHSFCSAGHLRQFRHTRMDNIPILHETQSENLYIGVIFGMLRISRQLPGAFFPNCHDK